MKVDYERLVGPEYMLAAMRVTKGKDMRVKKLPKLETWHEMILSEHSSDRSVKYRVYVEDIPYFAHTHIIRHHVGFEPYVYSQRDDLGLYETSDRDKLPQDTPINFMFDANAQALVTIARKRLCYKSHRFAQKVFEQLRVALVYSGDDYDRVLGNLLMRPCSWWAGYCAEPSPCGRIIGAKRLVDIHRSALSLPETRNDRD
jgi:hypothetical protein